MCFIICLIKGRINDDILVPLSFAIRFKASFSTSCISISKRLIEGFLPYFFFIVRNITLLYVQTKKAVLICFIFKL